MEPPIHADERRLELDKITDCIIGCAYRRTEYKIGNKLGSGFLEKVYENALTYKIGKEGLGVVNNFLICVHLRESAATICSFQD